MVNRIEEKRVNYTRGRQTGAPAPKKKTLADIMKAGRRQANAAKRTAAETQEFLKWALQNCNNQGDLVNTHGTPKQRKAFEKMERDLTPELTNAQRRQELAARSTNKKFTRNENFRQAILNAESVDDLKALEKEYGAKLPQSLQTTYNSRFNALEKAAKEAEALHAENQSAYNKLFGYGNGKHPSNTPLGTAQPTSSSGMTWEKYAQQHGLPYTKPISGVVEADRMAEEIIARNTVKPMEMTPEARAIYERVDKQLHKPTPVKPYEYQLSGKSAAESAAAFDPMTPEARATYERVDRQLHKPTPVKPYEHPLSGKSVKESAAVLEEHFGTKSKGVKLGKKGKFALVALALGAIGAGIAYLSKSKKAAPTTPSGEPIKPGFVPADTTKTEKVDTVAITPIAADTIPAQKADTTAFNPIPSSLLDEKVDTIEAQVVSEIPRDAETGKYIVKKGDNCWNIVKAEIIKEKGGEILSDNELDKEIIRRLPKFLKDNDLHYEKDKYTVLIYPNDTLNIKM